MFSPVKAIVAGALVFALGGVFFMAQPFNQQDAVVPGAEEPTRLEGTRVAVAQDCDREVDPPYFVRQRERPLDVRQHLGTTPDVNQDLGSQEVRLRHLPSLEQILDRPRLRRLGEVQRGVAVAGRWIGVARGVKDAGADAAEPVRQRRVLLVFLGHVQRETSHHGLGQQALGHALGGVSRIDVPELVAQQRRQLGLEDIQLGFMLMLTGFIKKMLLADGVAPIVEWSFGRAALGPAFCAAFCAACLAVDVALLDPVSVTLAPVARFTRQRGARQGNSREGHGHGNVSQSVHGAFSISLAQGGFSSPSLAI